MDKRVFEAQAQLDAEIELAENAAMLEFELRQSLTEIELDKIPAMLEDYEMLELYIAERGVDLKQWIYDRWSDDGVYEYFVGHQAQYAFNAITTLCSYFDIELWGMNHE